MTGANSSARSNMMPGPPAPPHPPESSGPAGAGTPPVAGEPWTVGRLLTWTTGHLKRRGSESPRLDAEVLLAQVLGWDRVKLYTHYDTEVGEEPRSAYRDLVRRRALGTPVAYLVGRKEFYSLTLAVTPAVLIPRPDSEFVVVEFLAVMQPVADPLAVDVGTGSGCLALACAQHHKTARFLAIDSSSAALDVARKNADALGLAGRVSFFQGDLLDPVAALGPFDAIVSNPPYIPTAVIPTLEPGVRDHEPQEALDGGSDGLRVVARLIDQAASLLKPGGHLIVEIGTAQEEPVRALVAAQQALKLTHHPRSRQFAAGGSGDAGGVNWARFSGWEVCGSDRVSCHRMMPYATGRTGPLT
jgi:release factor glutamine methyltransferase